MKSNYILNVSGIASIHRFVKDNAKPLCRTWEFLHAAECTGPGYQLPLTGQQTICKQPLFMVLTQDMFK